MWFVESDVFDAQAFIEEVDESGVAHLRFDGGVRGVGEGDHAESGIFEFLEGGGDIGVRWERADGGHGLEGGFLGEFDAVVVGDHAHGCGSDDSEVFVLSPDCGDEGVLEHGGEPEGEEIGASTECFGDAGLHGVEIEECFVDIKEEAGGSFGALIVHWFFGDGLRCCECCRGCDRGSGRGVFEEVSTVEFCVV